MKKSTIELLSCELLEKNKNIINDVDLLARGLIKEIGWHYYVDLIWIVTMLQSNGIEKGSTVLDAGAGNGILQYLLSLYGYNVISVDYSPRNINYLAKKVFKFNYKENLEKFSNSYISHIKEVGSISYKLRRLWFAINKKQISPLIFFSLQSRIQKLDYELGVITIYQADICQMKEIDSRSIDAIVSLSAIEHIEIDSIKKAIEEFSRVLKKDHPMIITTSAAKAESWFHENSKGWCFSREAIVDFMNINKDEPSNFFKYDQILNEYKENVSSIYYASEKNGMPWGKWDPEYLPVGIISEAA